MFSKWVLWGGGRDPLIGFREETCGKYYITKGSIIFLIPRVKVRGRHILAQHFQFDKSGHPKERTIGVGGVFLSIYKGIKGIMV